MRLNLNSLEFIQHTFIEHLPLRRHTVLAAFENTMMYKEALVVKSFFEVKCYDGVSLELSSAAG